MAKRSSEIWLEDFANAVAQLRKTRAKPMDEDFDRRDSAIQRFEFSFELAWKTLKSFLASEGLVVKTPKDALREAYQLGWICDEAMWLAMLDDRNLTSHTYDKILAQEIYDRLPRYLPLLENLATELKAHVS